jgi:hypothetical protein
MWFSRYEIKFVKGAVRQFAYWFAHGTIGAGLDTKETIKKQFIGQKLYCKFIRR